jgi:hypothetical protein
MLRRSRKSGGGGNPDPAELVEAFLTLRQAYLDTGDTRILIAAPEFAKLAVFHCPLGHPAHVRVLAEACIVLRMAHEATGNPSLLAEAIAAGRLALAPAARLPTGSSRRTCRPCGACPVPLARLAALARCRRPRRPGPARLGTFRLSRRQFRD